MIRAVFMVLLYLSIWSTWVELYSKTRYISYSSQESITNVCIVLSSRPAEYPIFIAVSTLSPVNTQIIIPVYRISLIVSGTPSCNLSSIAVEPTNIRSVSSLALTSESFYSRLVSEVDAFWNSNDHY